MESINLGALMFALLLLVWLVYAVPRIAERRDVMGQAHHHEEPTVSPLARDLSDACRNRRRHLEERPPMPPARLLSTSSAPQGSDAHREGTAPAQLDAGPHGAAPAPQGPRGARRGVLRGILVGLAALSALALVLAVVGAIAWYVPVVPLLALAAMIIVLRRAELARRAAVSASHLEDDGRADAPDPTAARPEIPAAASQDAAAAQPTVEAPDAFERARSIETSEAREWMPRPVPRPTYSLRGEVNDLGTRHREHRSSVLGTPVPYESADVEMQEAAAEETGEMAAPVDLDLDAILARRRGA